MKRSAPLQRGKPLRGGGQLSQRKKVKPSKWTGWPVAPAESQEPDKSEALRQAQYEARERMGWHCVVPGCDCNGMEQHHGLFRSVRPDLRARAAVLVALCRKHHRLAQRRGSWLNRALEEWVELWLAHEGGPRPEPGAEELLEVLRRHWQAVHRRHVSPIGPTD